MEEENWSKSKKELRACSEVVRKSREMDEENWSKSKKNDGKQNMLPNRFGSSFSNEMAAELSAQVAKHMPCQLDSVRGSSEMVFWSHGDGEELAHLRHLYPCAGILAIHGDLFKHTIKFMLQQLLTDCQYYGCLVQFWAPISTNTQIFLSTADQPFAITKDLISTPQFLVYRRHCLDAIIPIDDQKGSPAARVFEHGLPEFNSLISTYSHQEFPMRDAAISWGIRAYLALPVFSAPGQCCIGVLEIISPSSTIFRTLKQIHRLPKVVHLMSSQMFLHFCGDLTLHSKMIGEKSELTKLRNTLSGVCETYKLPMAQTWIPDSNTSLQSLITAPETMYYDKEKLAKDLTCYSDLYSLRKGQWVVGRAFSSQGCCFCWDASQMTITEYPMLPFARHAGLKSSFAICLRCTSNENSVYVVELYLCPLLWSAIRNFLNELMRILKEQLPDFRVASGEKLGKCLVVEVIKTCEDEDISSFEIGEHEHEHEHSPKADVVLGDFDDLLYLIEEEEIVQPHPHLEVDTTLIMQNSCEEKAPEADSTTNGEKNIIGSQRCDADHSEVEEVQNGEKIMLLCSEIDTASEQNQQTPQSANRIRRWNQDYGITREVLEQLFEKSRDDAAKTLDVSPSTLKRACRDFGIPRWRNHKRRRPNCSLKGICQTETCPVLPQQQGTISTAMTAKVTYKQHTFKFPLSSSSTMKYLEEEVTRRLSYLNISLEKFIKYQDEEDEWISLGCDLDLMYGMSMLRSSGKIVIRMMVHPNSH